MSKCDRFEVVWYDITPSKNPRTEQEHLIIVRFLSWLCNAPIYPAKSTTSGMGHWHGAFYPEDAPRVDEWLKENGIKVE
jgi:hypothetical protein